MMRCIYRGHYWIYIAPSGLKGIWRVKIYNPRNTREIEFDTGKLNIKPLLNYIQEGGKIERLETRA